MPVAIGRTSFIRYRYSLRCRADHTGFQCTAASQPAAVARHLVHVTELSNNFPFNDYLIVIGTDRVAAFLQAKLTCKNQ